MASKIKQLREDEQVMTAEPTVDVQAAPVDPVANDVVVADPTVDVEGAETLEVEEPVVAPEEGMVQATIPAGTEVFVDADELDTAVSMETGDAEVATDTAAAPVNPSDPTEPIAPVAPAVEPAPVVEACEECDEDKLEEEVSVGDAQGDAEVTIAQPEDKTFGEVPVESLAKSEQGCVGAECPAEVGPAITALDVTPEEAEAVQEFLAQLRTSKAEAPVEATEPEMDMPVGSDLVGSAIVAAEEVPVDFDALEDGFDDEFVEEEDLIEETISDKPIEGKSPNAVAAPLDVADVYDCNQTFVEDAEEPVAEELAEEAELSATDVSAEVEELLSKLESFLDDYETEDLHDVAEEESAKANALNMVATAAEEMDKVELEDLDVEEEDLGFDDDEYAEEDEELEDDEELEELDIESLVEPEDEMEESCEDGICPEHEEAIAYPATAATLKDRAEQIADENKVDGVDPFHDTDDEPNLVIKYESLAARRRNSMREHHRNLNRARFAENLNKCGKIGADDDLNADEVIEGSWNSNRFIEKYNESKKLNFNELREMLDSGLLG